MRYASEWAFYFSFKALQMVSLLPFNHLKTIMSLLGKRWWSWKSSTSQYSGSICLLSCFLVCLFNKGGGTGALSISKQTKSQVRPSKSHINTSVNKRQWHFLRLFHSSVVEGRGIISLSRLKKKVKGGTTWINTHTHEHTTLISKLVTCPCHPPANRNALPLLRHWQHSHTPSCLTRINATA